MSKNFLATGQSLSPEGDDGEIVEGEALSDRKSTRIEAQSVDEGEGRGTGPSDQRRKELADFLRTRREKIKPEQVGFSQGARRRTPGLRREEVAELAGVGTTWYTWLEQARDIQPSAEVLRRLGAALQLNQAEARHLFALAGKANRQDHESDDPLVIEGMRRFLNHAIQVPAFLLGGRWDILLMNEAAGRLAPKVNALPENRRNWLYLVFCDAAQRQLITNWETNARRLLAEFRASLGESVDNPWVQEMVDMLKSESKEFSDWWREHDVRDNSPVVLEVVSLDGGLKRFERTVLRLSDQTMYRILVFTPI